jgi:diguanylate cyclase (GGDEF)-like protein
MQPDVMKKLERCKRLPSLPAVAMEVLRLCQQPEFSMQDLAKIISKDPALSAKILKVINSPMFSLTREVTTVRQAVMWLGVQSVRTLALSFSLVKGLKSDAKGGFDHERYWKRSIISAVAAGELAKHLKCEQWEEAFLGALLQDIGMLTMKAALGKDYDAVYAQSEGDHTTLIELETDAWGADHSVGGAWLATKWNLPSVLRESMTHTHAEVLDDDTVEDPEVRKVVLCVALSGWLADIWVHDDTMRATQIASDHAASLLGLEGFALEPILDRIAELLPETSSLFEMNIGSPDDVADVLADARENLVMLSVQTAQRARQAEQTVDHLQQRTAALEDKSQRDPMTGLYNRHRMEASLDSEFGHSTRTGAPLSVIFCDIDHFKSVNDNHGHQAGDAVLIDVAKIVQGEVRKADVVARHGGEEFVIVLPDANAETVRAVAERIRSRVEQHPFELPGGKILRCTISLGGATNKETGEFAHQDALLHAADECVYAAKRSGRNRVVIQGDAACKLSVAS